MAESFILCPTSWIFLFPKYLCLMIVCHKPYSFSNFHHQLQSKLMFIFLKFLMPSPPFFLHVQIVSYLTRWYFFLTLPPYFLLALSIASIVDFGRRYTDIWYIGVLFRLELIKIVLPAMDIIPPFYTSSFLFPFSTKGSQSLTLSLLGLTGTPKYLKGKMPTWQLKISA